MAGALQTLEADAIAAEVERHRSQRPVPVLGEDELGDVLGIVPRRISLLPIVSGGVDILAVDEGDHVGILLDAAALPQIGE